MTITPSLALSFPLAAFGRWDWAVLTGYFALMIFIGFHAARRGQDASEYFLGGRSMPTWALAISIVGTSLSAATFIGAPDSAYLYDISYLIVIFSAFAAVVLVAILFVPKLYRAGTVTIYGYLGQRFGETSMIAVSCAFLAGRFLASGSRLFLAAIPLCLLLFGAAEPSKPQLVTAICLIGLVGTFYTVAGGIRAVIWIDVVQFVVVVGAALLSIGILLHKIPLPMGQIFAVLGEPGTGVEGHSKLRLVDLSADPTRAYTLWSAMFGALFLNLAAFGVDHDLAQRFLVARSALRGGLSLIASQLISLVVVGMFLLIGLLLYIYYRRPDIMGAAAPAFVPSGKAPAAYPQFLLRELPTVLSGLSIAGFFAIAQGSMDSAINAMAASAVADLYLPLKRRLGRAAEAERSTEAPKIAVAGIGVLMTLFAAGCAYAYDAGRKTLLDYVLGVMTFAFAGMLGVFLTALLTRRGNNRSVIAALLAGALAIALLQDAAIGWWSQRLFDRPLRLAWTWWMPIGTAVSFAVCVAGRPHRVEEEMDPPRRFDVAQGGA